MKRSKKFRWFIFPGMLVVLALAFSPVFVSKTQASPTVPAAVKSEPSTLVAGEKIIEKVGFYVLGITELNVATGSYTMDGYLNFECNLPCNENPDNPAFDVMNATGEPEISEQTSDTKGGTIHYYRIRVPLASNLILTDFPFDDHLLTLHLEDKILGEDELVYEYDPGKSGDLQDFVAYVPYPDVSDNGSTVELKVGTPLALSAELQNDPDMLNGAITFFKFWFSAEGAKQWILLFSSPMGIEVDLSTLEGVDPGLLAFLGARIARRPCIPCR